MAKYNNLIGPTGDIPVETKIVSGAPVKITRARSGSLGKEIEEDVIEKPNGNWLDVDLLNEAPVGQEQRQTGYGKWVERIGGSLKQIDETDDVSALPELLTSKEPVVQDAAEKRLRELKDEITQAITNGIASLDEEPVVQKAAEEKLKALNKEIVQAVTNGVASTMKSKEEAPKSRFDAIDISEEKE